MPVRLKRGRLGKPELAFIKNNVGKIPVEQIAKQLNRDVQTINAWIKENMAVDASGDHPISLAETAIRNELRASPEWKELERQFLPEELTAFEHYYCKLMTQFGNDILPTEIIQIFLLIKFQILMDRNLKSRSRALQDIQRLEKDIDDFYSSHPPVSQMAPMDRDVIINMENQLVAAREAEQSKTTEYTKLSEKHSALMKDLKGTREQRINKIENSKKTFLGLLRDLQDEEFRRQENEEIDFMREAVKKERDRLSTSHRYVDDSIDQPLLTPENV
jgi:hypothetical protein